MNRPLTYIVFVDFDGTITVNDIGDAMLEQFGDAGVCSESFQLYRKGEISARECWKKGFATISSLTREKLYSFVSTQSIDIYFKKFVGYCSEQNISVSIVSDGFDAYIDAILVREGLEWLPRFFNTLHFNNDGTIEPIFTFTNSECGKCAHCKRNRMLSLSHDDNVIVYIGDGYSDRCPVQYADIVFAKNDLVSFCETQNITFHAFRTFSDVLTRFQHIVQKSAPRKRRVAELARKEVFIME